MEHQKMDWAKISMFTGFLLGALALVATSWSAWLSYKEQEGAKARIASLDTRAREAEAKIAQANRDAEQARLGQLRIKALVSWRDFTVSEQATFLRAIGPEPGEALVSWNMGDVEAMRYAAQVSLALEGAGWKVSTAARVYARTFLTGIQLSTDGVRPERARLLRGFQAVGIPAEARDVPRPEFEAAYKVGDPQLLFIGSSPVNLAP